MSTLAWRIKSSFTSDAKYLSFISLFVLTVVVLYHFGISLILSLVFIFVITVFLITLRYPKFGLYLLIFNLPLNKYIPLFGVGRDSFSVSVNEVLLLILLSAIVLKKLFTGKITFPDSKLNRPIFLLLLFNVFGLLRAFADLSQSDYIKCWLYFFLWAEYFLIYFLILDLVSSKKEVKIILYLMILSGLLTVVSAFYQQIAGTTLRSIGSISETGKTQYRLISAFGFYSNDFGAYLLVVLSILLNLYFYVIKQKRRLVLILILPTLYTLFFTFSRGGILGLIALIIFLLILRKEHRKKIVIYSLFIVIISSFILTPVFVRWANTSYVKKGGQIILKKNISERLAQWEASLDQFAKHPLIGKGFHTYHYRELDYQSHFGIFKYIGHAHNVYLRLLIESGIFGLAAFIAMIYIIYSNAFSMLKYKISKEFELMIYIVLSSFSAFLVVAMTESILTVGRVTGPVFALIGLMVVMSRIEISNNEKLIHAKTI